MKKEEIEKEMDYINESVIKEGMNQYKYFKEKEILHKYEDILTKEEIQ